MREVLHACILWHVFRRFLHLLTLCIASLILLVTASAHASIPQARQGPKNALSAPLSAEKSIKGEKLFSAECTYQNCFAPPRLHWANELRKPKVAEGLLFRWKARPWSAFGGPSGTYDMRARVWSPDLGTFLSIDGLQYHDSTSTLFGWPGQNPLKFRDPSGHYRDGTNDNPVQDLVKGGLLPPGLLVMAKGFSLRANGISMMSSEATFERGDALRRCGSQLLALGGQITGTDAEVLVGAASMIPGVVKSVEGVAEAAADAQSRALVR
jgi:RHS repeat-associated protein